MHTKLVSPDPRIRLGNQQGRAFEPKRFQFAVEVAQEILGGHGLSGVVPEVLDGHGLTNVLEIEVDYDARHDYTHLRFARNGHRVDLRYYKVLAVSFDDKAGTPEGFSAHPHWRPSDSFACIEYIREQTREPIPDSLFDDGWAVYDRFVSNTIERIVRQHVWPLLEKRGYRMKAGNGAFWLEDAHGQALETDPHFVHGDDEYRRVLDILHAPIPGMPSNDLGSYSPDFPPPTPI